MPKFFAFAFTSAAILSCMAAVTIIGCQESPEITPAEPAAIVDRITADSGVTVVKLSNGLTVIVRKMGAVPVVTVYAFVNTGGIYEGKWLGTGISHLTEHLVAKGAVHDGQGAAAAKQTRGRVKQIGGQSNAHTSTARTGYYISAAASKTNDCIDLIADWMARPDISDVDFQREHGVVQRELEMGKDDPARQMWYAHSANFFAGHPASVPVIGYAEPLGALTHQDILDYHATMYTPQNMIFCIAGDVDVDAVLERTRQAFAGFARGRARDVTLPDVPGVSGIRRVTRRHKAIKEVMQRMSFRTIPLVHEDLYALDVLSYALTQGRASRLTRTIQREKKLVTSVGSSSWTPDWGAGMFTISFRAKPDLADDAETAILDELRSIVENGIDAGELSRAKRQKVADYVFSQQTAQSVASTLGMDMLSTGDVSFSRNYTDLIQDVTADDVHRMAKKYFTFDAMVVTRLSPEEPAKTDDAPTAQQARTDEASMFTLPNGLRVVLYPTNTVQLVSMALASKGGILLEDQATNGMGSLTAQLSIKGAGKRDAQQIAKFFDSAGGSVAGRCGNNTIFWQATVLDDSFCEALEIFADIIVRPTFAESELDILRPILETQIKQQDEHWHGQLSKFFKGKFFTDSPYRFVASGSLDVISKATVAQVAEYHKQNLLAGSSVLTVYGNFDAATTKASIEKSFAALPAGEVAIPAPPVRLVANGGELYTLKTDNKQAAIMIAAPGMKISNNEDRFAINVLDTIISGWRLPAGWLHSELRGKKLVYVVHAYNWAGLVEGGFMVYAACEPDKAEQVVSIIRQNLDKAANYTPTQEEIDMAVNSILTAELLNKQAMSALALSAGLDELYGFGYDFQDQLEQRYRKVTPAQVLRVAKKYLGKGYVTAVTTPDVAAKTPAEQ